MKALAVIIGGGVVAWLILGKMMTSEQQAAIAACGGPLAVPSGCPQLTAVNQKWAWLPKFTLSL